MPNHCSNSLAIKTQAPLSAFLKNGENGWELSFSKIIPLPKELEDTPSAFYGRNEDGTPSEKQIALEAKESENIQKYGYKNWYDFCVAEWGTKWDAYDQNIEISEGDMNEVKVSFQTAWAPPLQVYTRLYEILCEIDECTTVEASYSEPGCCFCGTWENGEDMPDEWIDSTYVDELDADVVKDHLIDSISDSQKGDMSDPVLSVTQAKEHLEEMIKEGVITRERADEIIEELDGE